MQQEFNAQAAMVMARFRDYERLLTYLFQKVRFQKIHKQNVMMNSIELFAKGWSLSDRIAFYFQQHLDFS